MGLLRLVGPRERAFATLTAACLLLLVAALLAGAVLTSQQILQDQQRATKLIDAQSAAWKEAGRLLASLQDTWNADKQTLDGWWLNHTVAFPSGSDLISLSGRVNLNSMTPFLLKDSELSATLLGKTVEDFVTYRTNKGPFARLTDYKDYFKAESLTSMFCVQSFFNVNTADEIILEKVIAARTGSEALGSSIRAQIRNFRTRLQILAQSDWDSLVGGDKQELGDLLTVTPELDVNTAPIDVLRAILRDPDLKLSQADAKLQAILAARANKPLDTNTLQQILGVAKNSLLMQYLGTRCYFLQAMIPEGAVAFTFVAVISYTDDSPPKVAARALDTSWTTQ